MLSLVLLPALLATSALGNSGVHVLAKREASTKLMARQDQSFTPGTNSGFGATCADAFGAGSIQCGSKAFCWKPSRGDECCTDQGGYPCPPGSFCLIKGKCCPDGIDPKTCAINNGIDLPAGFTKGSGTTSAAPTYKSSSSYSSTTSSCSTTTSTTSTCSTTTSPIADAQQAAYSDSTTTSTSTSTAVYTNTVTANAAVTAAPAPYTTISNATTVAPTGTGAVNNSPTGITQFTGAASKQQAGGMVAVVVGLVGLFAGLL